MLNFNTIFGPADEASKQIPPKMLADDFGEVSIRQVGDQLQVAAALAMGKFLMGDCERCVTGLALDASQSMKDGYGRGRTVPPEERKKFIEKGMYEEVIRDGVVRRVLSQAAREEVVRKQLIRPTKNTVHESAANMIESLIRTFSTGGVTSGTCEVIYWACGADGKEIESSGEVTIDQLKSLKMNGPQSQTFGPETHLAPPFRYFAERTKDITGVFVFVTDGHIDDEQEVIKETHRVASEIKNKARPSIKCVLIGVGKQIDIEQFDRIDDMEMPEKLSGIDIWNSKVLTDMRGMSDAWSEIFDPETPVGDNLKIHNDQGEMVYEKMDEVKALITFEMPAGSRYFDLVLDNDMKVHQELPT